MKKYIDVAARVVLDDRTPVLQVRDKSLFPEGYSARITNRENAQAIHDAFTVKYHDTLNLPEPTITPGPRQIDADQIALGTDLHGEPLTIPADDKMVMITGTPGGGKTFASLNVADWALRAGRTVETVTHPDERNWLEALASKHGRPNAVTAHSSFSDFMYGQKNVIERAVERLDSSSQRGTVLFIDMPLLDNDDERYLVLDFIRKYARPLGIKVVVMDHRTSPLSDFAAVQINAIRPGVATVTENGRERLFSVGIQSLI